MTLFYQCFGGNHCKCYQNQCIQYGNNVRPIQRLKDAYHSLSINEKQTIDHELNGIILEDEDYEEENFVESKLKELEDALWNIKDRQLRHAFVLN